MKNKTFIVFDKTKNSIKIKTFLKKRLIISSITNADVILVLGGDGFMLQTLKKFYKYKKPFYGVNTGNYGFLMNKFSPKNTIKNLNLNYIHKK